MISSSEKYAAVLSFNDSSHPLSEPGIAAVCASDAAGNIITEHCHGAEEFTFFYQEPLEIMGENDTFYTRLQTAIGRLQTPEISTHRISCGSTKDMRAVAVFDCERYFISRLLDRHALERQAAESIDYLVAPTTMLQTVSPSEFNDLSRRPGVTALSRSEYAFRWNDGRISIYNRELDKIELFHPFDPQLPKRLSRFNEDQIRRAIGSNFEAECEAYWQGIKQC